MGSLPACYQSVMDMRPADFKKMCNSICERLAENRYDPEAFKLLGSSQFLFACTWIGVDPEFASRRIRTIAAQRRNAHQKAH